MARIATGTTIIHSGTHTQELVEKSLGTTEYTHNWAWEADVDTDVECDTSTADPAVADPADGDPAVADPSHQRRAALKPRPKVIMKPSLGSTGKLYLRRGRLQAFNLTN